LGASVIAICPVTINNNGSNVTYLLSVQHLEIILKKQSCSNRLVTLSVHITPRTDNDQQFVYADVAMELNKQVCHDAQEQE